MLMIFPVRLLGELAASKAAMVSVREDGNPNYVQSTGKPLLYCQPNYSESSKMLSAYLGVVIMFFMAVYGRLAFYKYTSLFKVVVTLRKYCRLSIFKLT